MVSLGASCGMQTCAAMLQGVQSIGLSAVQTGMDNVRNMTGSPIAGIDPHELLDVRPLNHGAQSSSRPRSSAACVVLALITHACLIMWCTGRHQHDLHRSHPDSKSHLADDEARPTGQDLHASM